MAHFMADAMSPYPPDPYNTTWLPQHYPEHHHAFEHTRHFIGHALSGLAHEIMAPQPAPHLHTPRANAYESTATFYLDVELPGIKDKAEVELEWLSSGTLLLRTKVKGDMHAPLRNDEVHHHEAKNEGKKEGDQKPAEGEQRPIVYMTVHERKIGAYGRAFHFPVKVQREQMETSLEAGVLSITLPKCEVSAEQAHPPPSAEKLAAEKKKRLDTWGLMPVPVI